MAGGKYIRCQLRRLQSAMMGNIEKIVCHNKELLHSVHLSLYVLDIVIQRRREAKN